MGHIVKVAGIEMFATARHHSLECDSCGDTYYGGNGEDKGGPIIPTGYKELEPVMLVEHAIRLGWTGLEKYLNPRSVKGMAPPDLCPVCSAMKGAPYWQTVIHAPVHRAILMYRPTGPLLQKHSLVMPLSRSKIFINTLHWPQRDRYNEAPAVLELKIVANEFGLDGLTFETHVRWPGRKRGDSFKEKSPKIRLWSWGDDKVYAKELPQP